MISVFYVTASEPQEFYAAKARAQPPQVHELGKFFLQAHAIEHAESVEHSGRWTNVRITERQESKDDQHVLHRHGDSERYVEKIIRARADDDLSRR